MGFPICIVCQCTIISFSKATKCKGCGDWVHLNTEGRKCFSIHCEEVEMRKNEDKKGG